LLDAYLLSGLRVESDTADRVFGGVPAMQESTTYLKILEQGRETQVKKDILLVGEERLGAPEEAVKTHLEAIRDLEHLDRMLRRAARAASWPEILETP
jgi:hypothetical protein